MQIPLAVLKAFAPSLPDNFMGESTFEQEPQQEKEYVVRRKDTTDFCPIGCDPSRSATMISKPGRKKRGNFVRVFYRKSRDDLQKLLQPQKQVNSRSEHDSSSQG
jgi:HD superfamily phosphodiesterase